MSIIHIQILEFSSRTPESSNLWLRTHDMESYASSWKKTIEEMRTIPLLPSFSQPHRMQPFQPEIETKFNSALRISYKIIRTIKIFETYILKLAPRFFSKFLRKLRLVTNQNVVKERFRFDLNNTLVNNLDCGK